MEVTEKESTVEAEVLEALKYAKLDESQFFPTTQVLHFVNHKVDGYKFLEIDNQLLDQLKPGATFSFKGSGRENLVFVSENKTYEVKEAETSNSFLLTPDLKFKDDIERLDDLSVEKKYVFGVHSTYLELRPIKPHISKLKSHLAATAYKGPEYEYEINPELLRSYGDLVDNVQMSEAELREGLDLLNAVEIDGKWRLLSLEYQFRCVSYMLKVAEENSWSPDEVIKEETLESLLDLIPACVLERLFKLYTTMSKHECYMQFYEYKQDKVCRLFAQFLLSNAGKFNLPEFLQIWREAVPEEMEPNVNVLNGIALVDAEANPPVIWHFDEEDLPEGVNERFKALFEAKSKWTADEIAPYVERLTTDKLDVNALLTKYARSSMVKGVKMFSAKHSK